MNTTSVNGLMTTLNRSLWRLGLLLGLYLELGCCRKLMMSLRGLLAIEKGRRFVPNKRGPVLSCRGHPVLRARARCLVAAES